MYQFAISCRWNARRPTARPGLLIACLFAVLCLSVTMPAIGEDWPQFRGPRGDGAWHGPTLPQQWPSTGLPVLWKQPIGGGYAGVVAFEGRVYTMDRQREPTSQERVLCWDATTGEPCWTHAYPAEYGDLTYDNGPRAAPTVHEGKVFCLGALGMASCLDATTGDVLWSHDYGIDPQANLAEWWGYAASPVVFQDLVIFHVSAAKDACLVALDQRDGHEVWRAAADRSGYATPALGAVNGTPLLVAWTPNFIWGIDPQNGEVAWQMPYPVTYGVSVAAPIVAGDLAFVTGYWEGSKAIRLGPQWSDAELIWEDVDNLCGLMSQPLYKNGYVYSLDKRFGLTCFELATGAKLWDDGNTLTPRGRNPQASLVWLGDGDRVIALNSEGELVLCRLTPQGYVEDSRTKIIGPTWAHPAFAGRHAYARSDEEIVCVELVAE